MTQNGGCSASAHVARRFRRSDGAQSRAVQHALYYDLANSKLSPEAFGEPRTARFPSAASFRLLALKTDISPRYFLPGDKPSVEETTFSDTVPDADGKDEKRVGAGVGGEASIRFHLFVGPRTRTCCARWTPSWSS